MAADQGIPAAALPAIATGTVAPSAGCMKAGYEQGFCQLTGYGRARSASNRGDWSLGACCSPYFWWPGQAVQ